MSFCTMSDTGFGEPSEISLARWDFSKRGMVILPSVIVSSPKALITMVT